MFIFLSSRMYNSDNVFLCICRITPQVTFYKETRIKTRKTRSKVYYCESNMSLYKWRVSNLKIKAGRTGSCKFSWTYIVKAIDRAKGPKILWNGSVYIAQLLFYMVIELFKVKTWFSRSSYYSRVYWLSR